MKCMRTIDNDTLLGEICKHLSEGKKVKLRAKGNSMRPFIHGEEDILVIAPIKRLRKGDVVLARIDENRYVIHRIIRIKADLITLRGDANLYATEECTNSDIFGSVETIFRNGKEQKLTSPSSRLLATAWRALLSLRRFKAKISQRLNIISLSIYMTFQLGELLL